jgi:hypothetical protein
MQDHSALLEGIRPIQHDTGVVNNQSNLTTTKIAPAFESAAIAASIAGRTLLTEGAGFSVQSLFNHAADIELELSKLGQRPPVDVGLPAMSDPTSPYGGKSIGELLRDSGLDAMHVQTEATRLRHVTGVLPAIRNGILASNGATRKAAHTAALVAARAIVAELESWTAAVERSADAGAAVYQYDAVKDDLTKQLQRSKAVLARLSVAETGCDLCPAAGPYQGAGTAASQEYP